MVESAEKIVLVLCHTVFFDAFRMPKKVTKSVWEGWRSSRFLANFIIERQSELPLGCQCACTSQQVFDEFTAKLQSSNPNAKTLEILEVLRNTLYIAKHPSVTKVPLDDSVFVICDTLFSVQGYIPILVSNATATKKEKAKVFYSKKGVRDIPYQILHANEAEAYLHKKFPDICNAVDERTSLATLKM